MIMKVTYYLASSLDGYIAKPDGDVSWLDELGLTAEDTGYNQFYASVDAIVMGRGTYEMIESFGEWPYSDKPTWICSHNKTSPMAGMNCMEETSPASVVQKASEMGCHHLWLVGGGKLVTTFIEENLLTDISISLMPVLLGNGIPLVSHLPNHRFLKLKKSRQGSGGFMQLEYSFK